MLGSMRLHWIAYSLVVGIALAAELSPPRDVPRSDQIIWTDPGDMTTKDFANGPGGAELVPKAPFQFVEEDMGGSSPKLKLRDANDQLWDAKFGPEVHSDIFSSRLAWSVGYTVEPSYFVATGRIEGLRPLKRPNPFVRGDGTFQDARFQYRGQKAKFSTRYGWSWVNNPFQGTHELNGLKIMIMLTSDWDDKDSRDTGRDSNTAIFEDTSSGHMQFLYFIPDWGGSMGKWGGVAARDKWDCSGYSHQTPDFVQGGGGALKWGYQGQHTSDMTNGIRAEDVQWLMQYLGKISDAQLRTALVAAGARPDEIECFSGAVRERIQKLQSIAGE